MPKTVVITDEAVLAAVPTPNHGGAYTIVTHKSIIDEVKKQLSANNLVITNENYTSNLNGEVAQGIYMIQYGNDPELGLMFAWTNSYDKTLRFRCAIGAYIYANDACVIEGDLGNYGRKHIADANKEISDHISAQINSANTYFNALVDDKNIMKGISISNKQAGALLGNLYFNDEVITSSQLISIKNDYKEGNLWDLYTNIVSALRKSHPKVWMENQKDLHKVIKDTFFKPSKAVIDPNQLDLAVEAEKATADQASGLLNLEDYEPSIPSETTRVEPKEGDIQKQELSTEERKEEDNPGFASPPAGIPEYKEESEGSNGKNEKGGSTQNLQGGCNEGCVPLEDQVSGEYVKAPSDEELAISKPPIVNKEDEEHRKCSSTSSGEIDSSEALEKATTPKLSGEKSDEEIHKSDVSENGVYKEEQDNNITDFESVEKGSNEATGVPDFEF